jgi:hypothetical protein
MKSFSMPVIVADVTPSNMNMSALSSLALQDYDAVNGRKMVGVRSGVFFNKDATLSQKAMVATFGATVKAENQSAVNKVVVSILQNQIKDDTQANYNDHSVEGWKLLVKSPLLDGQADSAAMWFPFKSDGTTPGDMLRVTGTSTAQAGPPVIENRTLIACDSPGMPYPIKHPQQSASVISSLQGHLVFRAAIASMSTDTPNTIVVHATAEWQVTFDGTLHDDTKVFDPSSASDFTWSENPGSGSKVTTPFAAVDDNAKDAAAAGFEVCNPRALDEVKGETRDPAL